MPVILVLFGVVFAVVALLSRRRREPAEKPGPPAWNDPRAPADTLATPRSHHDDDDDGFDADG